MPGPDPQPPTHAGPVRGPSSLTFRNGCARLVLILLIAAAVVQTAVAATGSDGWDVLARSAPHAAVAALVHAAVGFAIAVLVNRLFPRAGLWGALAVALVALYPAATHWHSTGRAAAHVWMWVPFMVLLSLAALHAIPRVLREAAAVDRAGPWFAFRTITLPLAAPLLLVGIVFLAAAGLHPVDVRAFVVAHALLILAIAADGFATRSRR